MNNQFNGLLLSARQWARQPAAWVSAQSISARGLLTAAQSMLSIFGIAALVMACAMVARPDLAKRLVDTLHGDQPAVEAQVVVAPPLSELMEAPAARPAGTVASAEVAMTPEEKALMGTKKQQDAVTNWLSKRYRVAGDATNMLVSTAYLTAREIKLDPLLILAVMAIESGLNPFAESPMGAQGLMQVMSKVHTDKFQDMGGVQAALNPVANIRVGSLILKDYVSRGGSVEAGLKYYVGAAAFETDDGYGFKVLAEYNRLKQVSAGKKVPYITPPQMAAAPAKPKEAPTTVAQVEKPISADQLAGL
ncbi:transglycosylase SLT domain-containing protein [Pseudoduganella sp. DS3]|uniref:Transglycosylase SLT domain-containing protein n=1 Tax=Pseudoduganella guangdongensis TaxID=2692179 RepID=A0A6N9HRJ6_9BURK|nr:lytic transglycosylase domain-containing protein [Pseudoduganella guangdongensis]MYN05535.1 transglycosylase SLT domain-containing protein [Pseudoduganella guangdongensis]